MRQRNTSKKIQRSVLKYIEYEHGQELENFQKGEEILQEISKSLRDEVNREYFSKFLLDIKLFKLNFSLEFIMHLSSHIKERTYGPNETIFSQGDIDSNFYFICKGTI
jgi:CRP-like cAMP-binding protein